MKASVKGRFDRIDQKLDNLLEVLSEYSHEQLNKPPANGGWTAIQVMHHLLIAENYSYLYLKKKLSFNPELKRAGLAAGYRRFLLKAYLMTPFKFKAPKAVSEDALPAVSKLEEVGQQWKSNRHALRAFMETFPEEHYTKELYKHPLAGRMTLDGMLDFFEFHFDRHEKQIKKTLK